MSTALQPRNLRAAIESYDALKGLAPDHLELLAGCAANMRAAAGQYIFRSGEAADRFYLIRQGRVAVELEARHQAVIIQTLDAGELLGWSWLIPPYRWHLSARVIEDALLLGFDGRCIRRKFARDPALGYEFHRRFAAVMTRRLEQTFLQLAGLCG